MSNSWFTPPTWALARSNVEPIVSSKKNEAQHRIYEVKHLILLRPQRDTLSMVNSITLSTFVWLLVEKISFYVSKYPSHAHSLFTYIERLLSVSSKCCC